MQRPILVLREEAEEALAVEVLVVEVEVEEQAVVVAGEGEAVVAEMVLREAGELAGKTIVVAALHDLQRAAMVRITTYQLTFQMTVRKLFVFCFARANLPQSQINHHHLVSAHPRPPPLLAHRLRGASRRPQPV